jgi:immune inhibitor A
VKGRLNAGAESLASVLGGLLLVTAVWAMPPSPALLERDQPLILPPSPPLLDEPCVVAGPVQGIRRALVLLVDFADREGQATPDDFQQHLFNGSGSLTEYYAEVSYGALNLQGDVFGWFHLPDSERTYSGDSFGLRRAYPRNAQKLVVDAVKAADSLVDFSQYDENLDGIVDYLFVVHAGYGAEETDDSLELWSHKWQLSRTGISSPGPCKTKDGVKVDTYTLEPELSADNSGLAAMGVFAHEFGHVLGLPDLYDNDYSSSGIGKYCLMAYGGWGDAGMGPGSCPSHLCAWCKSCVGWLTPLTISDTISSHEVLAALPGLASAPTAYRLLDNPGGAGWRWNGSARGEYFMVENRWPQGFDLSLPGSGLLITHIDESRKNNDDESHPLVGLMQANGSPFFSLPKHSEGDGTELWSSNAAGFGPSSVPSSELYDGAPTGVSVWQIGQDDSLMNAMVGVRARFVSRVTCSPNPFLPGRNGNSIRVVYAPDPSQRTVRRFPGFRVAVFDRAGRQVRRLEATPSEVQPAERAAEWDGRDDSGRLATAGCYFAVVRLAADGFEERKSSKIILLR